MISAATPATNADAGLVPLTATYPPPGAAPVTSTPGAERTTDAFRSENGARRWPAPTAATEMTPAKDAG